MFSHNFVDTLRFSAPLYNICEDEGSICVDLILDEDALFDTIVEVNTYDDSATSKLCIYICKIMFCCAT